MPEESKRGISRQAMEIATAAATAAAGIAVCYGSLEIGTGWAETGPEAGYFPFYIGLLIIVGSLANFGRALLSKNWRSESFLDLDRAKPVISFAFPLIGFVVVALLMGLYVATLIYVAGAMVWQGGYRWWVGVLGGAAVTVVFYCVFEIAFQVPLLKGPIEGWLGIY